MRFLLRFYDVFDSFLMFFVRLGSLCPVVLDRRRNGFSRIVRFGGIIACKWPVDESGFCGRGYGVFCGGWLDGKAANRKAGAGDQGPGLVLCTNQAKSQRRNLDPSFRPIRPGPLLVGPYVMSNCKGSVGLRCCRTKASARLKPDSVPRKAATLSCSW